MLSNQSIILMTAYVHSLKNPPALLYCAGLQCSVCQDPSSVPQSPVLLVHPIFFVKYQFWDELNIFWYSYQMSNFRCIIPMECVCNIMQQISWWHHKTRYCTNVTE